FRRVSRTMTVAERSGVAREKSTSPPSSMILACACSWAGVILAFRFQSLLAEQPLPSRASASDKASTGRAIGFPFRLDRDPSSPRLALSRLLGPRQNMTRVGRDAVFFVLT